MYRSTSRARVRTAARPAASPRRAARWSRWRPRSGAAAGRRPCDPRCSSPMPSAMASRGERDPHRCAKHLDGAGIDRRRRRGSHAGPPSGPSPPARDAQDLALADVQVDVLEHAAPGARTDQAAHPQGLPAGPMAPLRREQMSPRSRPTIRRTRPSVRQVARRRRAPRRGRPSCTVTRSGDLEHLVQPMRDVDEGDAVPRPGDA